MPRVGSNRTFAVRPLWGDQHVHTGRRQGKTPSQ